MSTLRQCEWVRFSVGDVRRVECGRRGARGSPARYVYEPTLTLSDPAFSPPARRPDSPTADSPCTRARAGATTVFTFSAGSMETTTRTTSFGNICIST